MTVIRTRCLSLDHGMNYCISVDADEVGIDSVNLMHISMLSPRGIGDGVGFKKCQLPLSLDNLHNSDSFKFPHPGGIMYNQIPYPGDRPHNQI